SNLSSTAVQSDTLFFTFARRRQPRSFNTKRLSTIGKMVHIKVSRLLNSVDDRQDADSLKLLLGLALAATSLANPIDVLFRRQCVESCGSTCYYQSTINEAVSTGCRNLKSGNTPGGYPHVYNNYEDFNFAANSPYYEYPILHSFQPYTGGSPGPDRVVFTYSCALQGIITHTGADGEQPGLVGGDDMRSPSRLIFGASGILRQSAAELAEEHLCFHSFQCSIESAFDRTVSCNKPPRYESIMSASSLAAQSSISSSSRGRAPITPTSSEAVASGRPRSQSNGSPSAKRKRLVGERDSIHNLYEEMITIFVGPDRYPFYVYKELVKKDAAFFKTALDGFFTEGKTQEISLPEDYVQTFRVYQTWLQTGELRYNFDEEGLWLTLGKLWIFADKMCSPRFGNRIVDAIFDTLAQNKNESVPVPDVDTVHYIYDNTVKKSKLRRIFTRVFIMLAPTNACLTAYPIEFLAEVIARISSDTITWECLKREHGPASIPREHSWYYNKKGTDPPDASFVAQMPSHGPANDEGTSRDGRRVVSMWMARGNIAEEEPQGELQGSDPSHQSQQPNPADPSSTQAQKTVEASDEPDESRPLPAAVDFADFASRSNVGRADAEKRNTRFTFTSIAETESSDEQRKSTRFSQILDQFPSLTRGFRQSFSHRQSSNRASTARRSSRFSWLFHPKHGGYDVEGQPIQEKWRRRDSKAVPKSWKFLGIDASGIGNAVSDAAHKLKPNHSSAMYEKAKIRQQQLTRSKTGQLMYKYTFYLFLVSLVYLVLVGVPIWKGAVWYMYILFDKHLVLKAGLTITLGLGFLYAYAPLLINFEPTAPTPPESEDGYPVNYKGDTALIIPCYKSEKLIGATLAASLKIFPRESIFVIANGNSPEPLDNTASVCREYGVSHTWSPLGSKIIAQFVGCYVARKFPNVLLIDDDCLLPPNLPIVSDRMRGNIKCIGYIMRSVGPEGTPGSLCQQAQDVEYKLCGLTKDFAGKVGSVTFPHGCIVLWDRELLIKTFEIHPGFS
ncbi:MAG: hypothetical protein Q9174_005145, partial [Haloplaca sp. 1 TL-2023]